MKCQDKIVRITSTLPPPCHHCRPPPFCCPKNGCPPKEACPPRPLCPQISCGPLRCRERPQKPPPPPTLCIARPCPQPVIGKPRCLPAPPKIQPPKTSVRFCIQNTCEGMTYCPCYEADMPRCSPRIASKLK